MFGSKKSLGLAQSNLGESLQSFPVHSSNFTGKQNSTAWAVLLYEFLK
jgi:hypothetical protein